MRETEPWRGSNLFTNSRKKKQENKKEREKQKKISFYIYISRR